MLRKGRPGFDIVGTGTQALFIIANARSGLQPHKMKKLLFSLLAVFGLMFTIGSSAGADSIDFYLTTAEIPPGGTISQANAVEVVVTTTGSGPNYTGATVEFVAPSGGTIVTPIWINVNGDFTATVSIAGGVVTTPGEEDGFGTMNLGTGAIEN